MPPEDKSHIDELQKTLYSRNAPDVRTRRKLRYEDIKTDVQSDWQRPPEEPVRSELTSEYKDNSMSFLTKLLIASILFCIAAVGIGAFVFWNGGNFISANNIDIAIHGPVSVPGGTPVAFDITVTNKNSVDLRLADMNVTFPAGATDPKNPTVELTTYRELLGDIPPGGTVKKTVNAVIFGEQNTQKHVAVAVTYQVKGSTASFTKEQTYDVLVNSSPVNLTVTSFKEITAGQEFDLKFAVKSNSQETLKNILVSARYPFGFTFISSDIKPLSDNATWRLGDLPPGGGRTITVHGKLQGENEDSRVFHVAVGAQSSRNPGAIGTEYMSAEQEIAIQKPFMSVAISLDGDQTTEDAVGDFNHPIRVEVNWFNNLPTTVSDAEITLKLSGSAYDKTLVQLGTGFFRSADDTIVWNRQTVPQLASVGAGESGTLTFTVTPRDLSTPGRPVTNPQIIFSANVAGKRTQESGVPEALASAVTRTDRISSSMSLSGAVVRTSGPFGNSGPIPPRAEQQTTYTVLWTVDNTANTVNDAQVTATLPAGIKWMNLVNPPSENVNFDSQSNTIIWNLGNLGTYTAVSGQRRQLAFLIALIPSVNQVGNIPTLINEATLSGTDSFTGVTLTSTQGFLTTRFSTDPTYREGNETVIR